MVLKYKETIQLFQNPLQEEYLTATWREPVKLLGSKAKLQPPIYLNQKNFNAWFLKNGGGWYHV